jgi:hypothetical protein
MAGLRVGYRLSACGCAPLRRRSYELKGIDGFGSTLEHIDDELAADDFETATDAARSFVQGSDVGCAPEGASNPGFVTRSRRQAGEMTASEVTPPGIEKKRTCAKPSEDSRSPTEIVEWKVVSRSLSAKSSSKVAKLAKLARNAVQNCDLHRATELLGQILETCEVRRLC